MKIHISKDFEDPPTNIFKILFFTKHHLKQNIINFEHDFFTLWHRDKNENSSLVEQN